MSSPPSNQNPKCCRARRFVSSPRRSYERCRHGGSVTCQFLHCYDIDSSIEEVARKACGPNRGERKNPLRRGTPVAAKSLRHHRPSSAEIEFLLPYGWEKATGPVPLLSCLATFLPRRERALGGTLFGLSCP